MKISAAIVIGYVMSLFIIAHVIVIAIPNGRIICSVGHVINYTMAKDWSCIINVPRTVNIIGVINIYNASAVREITIIVINYVKPTNPNKAPVIILNINIKKVDHFNMLLC